MLKLSKLLHGRPGTQTKQNKTKTWSVIGVLGSLKASPWCSLARGPEVPGAALDISPSSLT